MGIGRLCLVEGRFPTPLGHALMGPNALWLALGLLCVMAEQAERLEPNNATQNKLVERIRMFMCFSCSNL